jgi:mannose-6-phosphate isomerase-like protein (cupin superfamily)
VDVRFEEIFTQPENEIFRVVFFPDRIYHARYLCAARSSRYRYNVTEVRSGSDVTVIKGEVFLSGERVGGVLRLEYTGSRLVEQAREFNRRLGPRTKAWVRVMPADKSRAAEATVTLHWDPVIGAYAVEIWQTLTPPEGSTHDYRVLALMGRDGPITRVPALSPALGDLKALRRVAVAFREHDRIYPTGQRIGNPQWDNAYLRSHQEPRVPEPSSPANTIADSNYLLDFQRAFFIPDAAQIQPVRYRNAMTDEGNPERRDDNIIEMRWLFQREFGSEVVFFHEVTVPPGCVEGTHRHIGSEELYYVVAGTGLAYLNDGDDPNTRDYPLVERPIYGLDPLRCREVPVRPGSVLYTKSGGVHGIRNPGSDPLKFVAFLYQTT